MEIQTWATVAVGIFNAFVGWKMYRLKQVETGAVNSPSKNGWLWLWFACLVVGFVPYLYFSQPKITNLIITSSPIQQYGVLGKQKQLYAIVSTLPLMSLKETDEIMIVGRPGDHLIDAFKDSGIAKSAKFAINGASEAIQFPISDEFIERAIKANGSVEFYLVAIPKKVTPESIVTLSDVALLGGTVAASNEAHSN